ncbi:MAG TPA: tRNA (adenosine(37)-N6)-dimethylallyltransferase MiaA [Actinomycetota bacterium]|nr:tRNA (adenosine(37)-N6)-dimethylallyltransferase MiaA [Actinomycetota bacterium]
MSDALLALIGQTATGKTRIAEHLAPRFSAEIVAADSMTVYRGMDIGTAKPSVDERARVRHHLIDIVEPGEPFTVARFQRAAREAIADIRARGGVPLIVGGSGLHFRAAVDALDFPPADAEVRARLEDEELPALVDRLRRSDPDAAAFVDPANKRRVVRALEVIEITGRPFSSFRDAWDRYLPAAVAGLHLEPEELDRRVRARLDAMLERGWLDEIRRLVEAGFRAALEQTQAIGYREALALAEGRIDRETFLDRAARATRRFSRRQLAWFRRDPRVRWFDASDVERAEAEVGAYYSQQIEKGFARCDS